MSEINEIDKLVLVDVPKVIENEQIYVYIPIAVGNKAGLIAIPADSKDFEVIDGNLKLKWDIDKLLATKLDIPDKGKASRVFTVNDQGKVTYVPYSASQIIVGELSIPMRTVNGDLIVRDTPVDEHGAVNKKYVDTRDNELDAAINTKLNKSSTPGIVYANTNDGELSEPTQIPYSSDPNVDGESIVSRTYDGYFDVKDPLQDAHAANKKYADRIFNDGGTIKKDLNVLGDLKVQGKLVYVTGTVEGLEQQYLELNTNKTLTIGTSGLLINKGKTASGDLGTYAIVYDAVKDAVVCGLGTTRVDKIDGKDVLVFEFNEGEGLPLTIRDESDKMTDGHLLKWDADGNKLTDTGKSINELLTVIEPTGVQTEFVAINKDFDGNIKQISLRGVFTPLTNYETFLPVLRGLQGQVKGQTAPLAYQTDLDLINRGELKNKLSNYEKSPHYVLIEKVITGYSLLNAAPSDFATNYASYYKTNGKARNDIDFAYVALTEAETFETGKYYSKAGATEYSKVSRSSELDGNPYSFSRMKIFTQNEVNKIKQWAWLHIHINNSYLASFSYYFNTSQTATKADVNVYTDGNSVFATNTLLNSELYGNYSLVTNRVIFDDNNIKITKFETGDLFTDTTLLIYGVKE